jgi:AraC family transcriptional regulator
VESRAESLKHLPENVLSLAVAQREWNGVRLDVISSHCAGRVAHHLAYETHTRLGALLEEVGSSPCEPRLHEQRPCPVPYVPRNMQFVPAGMELWGFGADMRFVKDAVLTFEAGPTAERLEQAIRADRVAIPRLRFADDHLWTLMKFLSDVVDDTDPSTQLYGDGLTAAIVARLMARPAGSTKPRAGLAPWQLRRVLDYLDAHLTERVELATLATLVGLSQSHFSHAFRVSTGVAPYRWQLDARVRRAQQILLDTRAPLEQVAEATGFADAVHFGRTFRRLTGATPAAWRRDRRR